MHWILQNNLFNEKGYQTILDTLERFDIPYSIHKVIPFVGELLPEPELETKNVMCMGSYSLRHAARKYGWSPGVFDLEPFNFNVQMQHWGDHMLNYDSRVMKFQDATFGDHEQLFIRPIEDSKSFAGKIFDRYEFEHWQKNVCELGHNYGIELRYSYIQLAVPKKIYSEYRYFIVNGTIATASMYKLGDTVQYAETKIDMDNPIQEYVEQRIQEWQPLSSFVIDVADTAEGLKIVEINTLNSCGFYACDVQQLVMELQHAYNTE